MKKMSKPHTTDPIWKESTGDWWIHITKSRWCGKSWCHDVIMSVITQGTEKHTQDMTDPMMTRLLWRINEIRACMASSHTWMDPEMSCLSHNTPGVGWEESMRSVHVWPPPIHEWTQRWAASAPTHLEQSGRNQWDLCMYGVLPFVNEPRDELP